LNFLGDAYEATAENALARECFGRACEIYEVLGLGYEVDEVAAKLKSLVG